MRKPILWSGLVLGFLGLQVAAQLPAQWREVAFGSGWLAFFLAWTQLSPCAGGACAMPNTNKSERSLDKP